MGILFLIMIFACSLSLSTFYILVNMLKVNIFILIKVSE